MIAELSLKYPQYSFLNVLDVLSSEQRERNLCKSLNCPNHYYSIPDHEYKQFMINWSGEDIDICSDSTYSWYDNKVYYVYTSNSRRVLAKIMKINNKYEYFLALNV